MNTIAVVATILSSAVAITTLVTFFLGRTLKRIEDRSKSRNEAIDVMVQHFNPESELSKRIGGTLPDRMDTMSNTLAKILEKLDEVAHIDRKVTSIQTDLADIRSDVETLNKEVTLVRKEVDDLQSELHKIRSEK